MPWFRRRAGAVVLVLAIGPVFADEAPTPTPSAGLLLPVYAVDVTLDAAGAVDAKAWAELKPAGFNAVRFPVDVSGGKAAATRVAALCAWAQAEKVGLIPVLVLGAGTPVDKKLEGAVEGFARDLAEAMRGGDPAAYTRILTFQVGPELNHPGRNGRLEGKKAVESAIAAAKALREAERKALEANGLSPTPLSVDLSFDVPLLAAGAGPTGELADASYASAYAALKQDLAPAAASPDVDIVTVTWFAGSQSAGGAARFAALLRALAADLPGKQVALVTGVSSAFRPAADAEAFAKVAFANLAEHRTSGGADAAFIGVVFHRGTPAPAASAAPAGFEEARAGWTPEAVASGLLGLWKGEKTSDPIAYWASEVEARFALLSADGASPALAGLKQVAGIVTDPATQKAVAEAVASPTPTPAPTPAAPDTPGATPVPTLVAEATPAPTDVEDPNKPPNPVKEKLEAAAMAALDQLLSRLTNEIGERLDGSGGDATPAPATLSIVSAACAPASVNVQQQVTCQVSVRNESQKTDATGVSVALLDSDAYLLGDETMVEGITIVRQAQAMVPVKWKPAAAGTQAIQVKVYDGSYAEVASASAGPVTVKKSGGGTTPVKPGKWGVLKPGFPWVGAMTATKKPMMKTLSAQGPSIHLPIANTSARMMAPMTAALYVGSTRVATRPVAGLMPGQSREVVFDGVRIPSGGEQELRVTFERPGTSPFAAGTLRVDAAKLASGPASPPPTTTGIRSVLPGPRVTPVATLRPTLRPVATPTPTPGGRRPVVAPTAVPTPAGHVDLGFLGGARVSPTSAKPGQAVSVSATVVNRGTRPSGAVGVSFEVQDSRGRAVARGMRRLAPVAARGQSPVSWSGSLQSTGPWRVVVQVEGAGDANPGDNTTTAAIQAVAVRMPVPRRR